MIRINLLPHREEKRKAKGQQFYVSLGLVGVLACLIVFLGYTIIDGYISAQESRNDFMKKEIAILDKEIEQIKRLQEQIQALLARKQIIESLQQDRADAVRLLSELVKQMPEGVYIRSLKQTGDKVMLNGFTQSNARVSTLMRNVEASPWLKNPQLVEIKASTVDKRRLNEFTLEISLKREQPQQDGGEK